MHLVELVPRDLDKTLDEASSILSKYSFVSGINIPDVLRLHNRSYDVALDLNAKNILAIPHIRAIDFPIEGTLAVIENLVNKNVNNVLLISGDLPDNPTIRTYDVSILNLIRETKKRFPGLNVYAALDPYRQSLKQEMNYIREKIDSGADGFFTQPFFDINFASIFLDKLQDTKVFLGVSPVISEQSYNYWINRNSVVFPSEFKIDLNYNCSLARKLMALSESYNQNTYHMPIKVDVFDYLNGLF